MTNTMNVIKVRTITKGKASGRELYYSAPSDIKIGDTVEILTSTFKNYSSEKIANKVKAIVVDIENDNDKVSVEYLHPIIGKSGMNDICSECETMPCVCEVAV